MTYRQILPLPASTSVLEYYLAELTTLAPLSAEEEHILAQLMQQGDPEARARLIEAHLRFVVCLARRLCRPGRCLADLIQDGNVGLVHAVDHFDPAMGCRLSTYAFYWIKQAMGRGLDRTRFIRLPAHLSVQSATLVLAHEQVFETTGREPNEEQLAEVLGLSPATIRHMRRALAPLRSLDWIVRDQQGETCRLGELVPDEEASSVEEQVCAQDEQGQQQYLYQQFTCLTRREREALILALGLDGHDQTSRNHAQVGALLGISRERVRQLMGSATKKLRAQMTPSQQSKEASR